MLELFRYFLGRNETLADGPTLVAAHKAYRDSGGSFKALLASLLSSESFVFRTVPLFAKNSQRILPRGGTRLALLRGRHAPTTPRRHPALTLSGAAGAKTNFF